MSEYTFRELAVRPRVTYVGYKDASYDIRDNDIISRDYFEIVEFPEKLTSGKNLIKLRGNPANLVDQSKIHIEILDYNDQPVFYKPLDYIEQDGTRVIAIYIYPDTSPGNATVYLAGRARINVNTGQELRFSRDYNDPDYYNIPNILWSRTITIAPNTRNNAEIIFTQQPKVTVTEIIQTYSQPITVPGILTQVTASGINDTFGNGFGYISTDTPSIPPPPLPVDRLGNTISTTGDSLNQLPPGSSYFINLLSLGDTLATSGNTIASSPSQIIVGPGEYFELSNTTPTAVEGFRFNINMAGGLLKVTNPWITCPAGANAWVYGTEQNGYDVAIPLGMAVAPTKMVQVLGNAMVRLYGTWTFAIIDVINSTKAKIAQIDGYTNNLFNTNDAPVWALRGNSQTLTVFPNSMNSEAALVGGFGVVSTQIGSAFNFTASYIAPDSVVTTQNSASFADIILSNIEPETGDVFKVKTLYKPSGQFGDFIDLGDSILEEQDILIDTGSFETNVIIGSFYENFGKFESLQEINTYWTASIIGAAGTATASVQYDDALLIGGAKLIKEVNGSVTASYASGQALRFSIKPEYRPKLYANTIYKVRARALLHAGGISSSISQDSNITYPRLDIYISGSSISSLSETFVLAGNTSLPTSWQETLIPDNFKNNGVNGYRVGTIIAPTIANTLVNSEFLFKVSNDVDASSLSFIVRAGDWTIGDIQLKSHKETGFSPNYTRIGKRIPTEHLKTPLTFKFQYFDYTGRLADSQTTAYGVVFQGENYYIDGTNNLITGSVFLGNGIGTGVEMAGVNSAYVRSVGFTGYNDASNGGKGGFMIFSGSVLPGKINKFTGNAYDGVGFELVDDADTAHMIFYSNPSVLDIKAKSFFIGDTTTQFISGANTNIEISSSIFHLDPTNNLLVIGADAIINATLSADSIFVPAGTTKTNARAYIDKSGNAGFDGDGTGNYNVDFQTGSAKIANWTITSDRLTGGNMIIKSDGTIQSSNFIPNQAGSGFILTAANGGFLEVENAKIRGTLATAVFEKETVNAVGGQLFVANSTTLTASADFTKGIYPFWSYRLGVVNVTGFEPGEICALKKVSSTGFSTEYVKIYSSSRFESSEVNLSGYLFVSRSYGSRYFVNRTFLGDYYVDHFPADQYDQTTGALSPLVTSITYDSTYLGSSSSLGDIPAQVQSYSGSQVIVSTGRLGTGYIRLNANPSDQATPYIDIVERTGSGIYDVSLKARLGDLSGLANTSYVFGRSNPGFGLATDNVFLQGGIVANFGTIGGFNITADAITGSGFYLSGSATGDSFFISASNFNVKANGQITGSDVIFTGGKVGGFTLATDRITGGNLQLKANGQITGSEIVLKRTISSTEYTLLDTVAGFADFLNIARLVVNDNTEYIRSTADEGATAANGVAGWNVPILAGETKLIISWNQVTHPDNGDSSVSSTIRWRIKETYKSGSANNTNENYNLWTSFDNDTDSLSAAAASTGSEWFISRTGTSVDFDLPHYTQGSYVRIELSSSNNILAGTTTSMTTKITNIAVTSTRNFAQSFANPTIPPGGA
jgi:hypothetical protein